MNNQKKKIYHIDSVDSIISKKNPPTLEISSVGKTATGGWDKKSGELVPYVYVNPPADGIYDFDFVATAPEPSEIVPQVLTPITANTYTWEKYPPDLKGVRVHGNSNSKEILI